MGRIKTKQIKRVTRQLLALYSERFTSDFVQNRNMLASLTVTHSPKLRNLIAGHLTKLVKAQKTKLAAEKIVQKIVL